eukprot:m51a1_g13687 hypothetical protein (75) ;mRNA; f:53-891
MHIKIGPMRIILKHLEAKARSAGPLRPSHPTELTDMGPKQNRFVPKPSGKETTVYSLELLKTVLLGETLSLEDM